MIYILVIRGNEAFEAQSYPELYDILNREGVTNNYEVYEEKLNPSQLIYARRKGEFIKGPRYLTPT